MSREEDGFLARWSRRKLETRERPAPEPEPPPAPDPGAPPATGEAAPDPDAITPEELAALPPVESIGPQTDIAGFLRKGVPAALRKAALRRVWAADPAIRDYVNEAREYAYDWNVPGGVPGSGALLPTDDVQAMLARVFGEAPEWPAAPAPEPTESRAPDLAQPQDAAASGGEPPEPAAGADPAPAIDEPKSVQNAPEPAPGGPEDPGLRRFRRHGGAFPV